MSSTIQNRKRQKKRFKDKKPREVYKNLNKMEGKNNRERNQITEQDGKKIEVEG